MSAAADTWGDPFALFAPVLTSGPVRWRCRRCGAEVLEYRAETVPADRTCDGCHRAENRP